LDRYSSPCRLALRFATTSARNRFFRSSRVKLGHV
jgi:hypothetical protein